MMMVSNYIQIGQAQRAAFTSTRL